MLNYPLDAGEDESCKSISMRRLVVVYLLLVIGQMNGLAQESGAKIGITYSAFGRTDILYSTLGNADIAYSQDIIQGQSLEGKRSYAFGLTYVRPIYQWLDFESGFDISNHKVNPESMNVTILSIPVSVRVNFLKYLFFNGGALIGIDLTRNSSISDQNGLGFIVGFGAEYNFKSGISIFVNPYSRYHTFVMIPAAKGHKNRLNETGIRIGITYELSRLLK